MNPVNASTRPGVSPQMPAESSLQRLPGSVLVVGEDLDTRRLLHELLTTGGNRILCAASGEDALALLSRTRVDLILSDTALHGTSDEEFLHAVSLHDDSLPVILMASQASVHEAVEMVKSGAFHYLLKPLRDAIVASVVSDALRERHFNSRALQLAGVTDLETLELVAESPAMRRILTTIRRASRTGSSVLLHGDSGTGKEVIARALHSLGPRRLGRFVAVNCSAIPENLMESQLFGHRRGSFTDANEDRTGLFQEAHGGTLFLDEIGDLPLTLQGKLLRVLQERSVQPVGSVRSIPVDVRIVAATNKDLEKQILAGQFRHDLYYRLDVIAIRVPPLRERPEDLLPLSAFFLKRHAGRLRREGCTLSAGAQRRLERHHWPGNARELENVIERALVLGSGRVIRAADLPETLGKQTAAVSSPGALGVRQLKEVERAHILATLRAVQGNKSRAARLLGLDRKTLHRRLGAYQEPDE